MFDAVFQALFAYSPFTFSRGTVQFYPTAGSIVATVVVAILAIVAVMTYRRVRVNEARQRDRIILTTLRVAALAVVLFCLFRPTLVVRAAVPQRNVVAVLMDDSRSMQIPDWEGKARAEFIRREFGDVSGPLMKSLSDRF